MCLIENKTKIENQFQKNQCESRPNPLLILRTKCQNVPISILFSLFLSSRTLNRYHHHNRSLMALWACALFRNRRPIFCSFSLHSVWLALWKRMAQQKLNRIVLQQSADHRPFFQHPHHFHLSKVTAIFWYALQLEPSLWLPIACLSSLLSQLAFWASEQFCVCTFVCALVEPSLLAFGLVDDDFECPKKPFHRLPLASLPMVFHPANQKEMNQFFLWKNYQISNRLCLKKINTEYQILKKKLTSFSTPLVGFASLLDRLAVRLDSEIGTRSGFIGSSS